MILRVLIGILSWILPWPLRRWVLQICFGYQIHEKARLGFCVLLARRLVMEEHARIGHLTVCIHLDLVHLHPHASIGRGNWITGFPPGHPRHFSHEEDRHPELIVGEHSAITNRHLIDCTSRVQIGRFTTFAGFQSQILTHSIDLEISRQSSAPITIGDYCFIGTNCVLLGGSALPHYSVLAAKSLLNKPFTDEYSLYGGVPARVLQAVSREWQYFHRTRGTVD